MTDQEINVAIAEACGKGNRWVLMKRGLYYRPSAHGYTNHIEFAWVIDEATASKHVYQHGNEPVTKHPAPIPNYCTDLNAMHEAVMNLPTEMRVSFNHQLMNSLQPNDPYALDRTINATARQRAEAFLRTIGKWKEQQ